MANNPRFTRPLGERRYKKMFIISTEGAKTEPRYFGLFNQMCGKKSPIIHIECIASRKNKSAPQQVLKRMTEFIQREGLKRNDEAWLVIDKDQWTDDQLDLLYQWSLQRENFGLAVSNPKFEYWLLLHFEDGNSIASAKECVERLKRFIPEYDKDIAEKKIAPGIQSAISRAKSHAVPACTDWPRITGTTVYRLVERIIAPVEDE